MDTVPPRTACPLCRNAETAPWKRVATQLRQSLLGYSLQERLDLQNQVWSTYHRALAGAPATWYERHRAEYEKTGDDHELARMLRHVKEI